MPRNATDFHFRLTPELRARLGAAVKLFTVTRGDRPQRRKVQTPSISELVVACIELGLGRVEAGESILAAPSLTAKAATQKRPKGIEGAAHVAPLETAGLYAQMQRERRWTGSLDEVDLLDRDALRIEGKAVLRGNLFTDPEDAELAAMIGAECKVDEVSRKRATVRFGRRKAVQVHVYDLVPVGLFEVES